MLRHYLIIQMCALYRSKKEDVHLMRRNGSTTTWNKNAKCLFIVVVMVTEITSALDKNVKNDAMKQLLHLEVRNKVFCF